MMVVFRHLQLLELCLNAVILIKPLLTDKFDGDSSVYDEVTRFDTTLRTLDKIRCSSCLPCLTRMNSLSRPRPSPPYSTQENHKVCKAIQCSFQGSCLRLKKDGCNSWTITVILEKRKYVLFSNISAFSADKDNNLNVTCYDTGTTKSQSRTPALRERQVKMERKRRNTGIDKKTNTFEPILVNTDSITVKTPKRNKQRKDKRNCMKDCRNAKEFSTTVSKEPRLGMSTSANAITDPKRNGDFGDDKNDGYSGSGDNDDDDAKKGDDDIKSTEPQNEEKCRKRLKQCRNSFANQKDCPASDNVGILFITHVIAAVFGAGILYFLQFIIKYRGKRNDESKPDTNEGMANASYGHMRGTDILPISNVSRQEEAIYNEVDDKPCMVLIDNTSYNCSTGGRSNNRKHSKLPDIPYKNEKDEDYLLPQTPKNLLLPDTHAHLSDKVKTPVSVVAEELSIKDLNESNQGT